MNVRFMLALVAAPLVLAGGARAGDDLARFVPAKDLLVYVEDDGMTGHEAEWKATAAAKIWDETGVGPMIKSLVNQTIDQARTLSPAAPAGAEAVGPEQVEALAMAAMRGGLAGGVCGDPGAKRDKPDVVVFALGGVDAAAKAAILGILKGAGGDAEPKESHGRMMYTPAPDVSAWFEKGDAIFVAVYGGDGAVDAVIAASEKKAPSAVDSPRRKKLAAIPGSMKQMFIDVTPFTKLLPAEARGLGLEGVKALEMVAGADGPAMMTMARIDAPGPRTGVMAFLDQGGFSPKQLPPIPLGVTDFSVAALDPGKALDLAMSLVETAGGPQGKQVADQARQVLDQGSGIIGADIRSELLGNLGPVWAGYVQPSAPSDGLGMMGIYSIPKVTLAIEVRDAVKFAATMDKLVVKANAAFRKIPPGSMTAGPGASRALAIGAPETLYARFVPLSAPYKGYMLAVPPAAAPIPAGLRPTLLLGRKYLVISVSPGAAAQAIVAEGDASKHWISGPGNAELLAKVPAKVGLLGVSDPRTSVPGLLANLPAIAQAMGAIATGSGPFQQPMYVLRFDPDDLPTVASIRSRLFPNVVYGVVTPEGATLTAQVSLPSLGPGLDSAAVTGPVAIALVLPAVQSAREAARRSQAVNNLKQIGLAFHNYHSTSDAFPPQAIRSKTTKKPLLSWRVAILPYLEQQALYNEFHLDEPWDSPHNLTLLDKMPNTYADPSDPTPSKSETPFQGFAGKEALFSGAEGPSLAEITDGTSNTLMVVEAKKTVPWTKPEDVPFDANKDVPELGGRHPGGFNALFCDGSVRFIKHSINKMTLKALITRAGGEVISSDSF